MDIEVEGYDKAIKQTEKIMKDIDQLVPDMGAELVSNAEKILKRAKDICNDPNCLKIKKKRIEFTNNIFSFEVTYEDGKSEECMIQAIKESLSSLPEWQKHVFETEIKRLEDNKNKND